MTRQSIRPYRDEIRSIAIQFLADRGDDLSVENTNDIEQAIRLKFADTLGPILLHLAIDLAIKLIKHWLSKGYQASSISLCFVPGEPGFSGDDNDGQI